MSKLLKFQQDVRLALEVFKGKIKNKKGKIENYKICVPRLQKCILV